MDEMTIRDRDTVVITSPRHLSRMTKAAIAEAFQEANPSVRVIILDNGMTYNVIRGAA